MRIITRSPRSSESVRIAQIALSEDRDRRGRHIGESRESRRDSEIRPRAESVRVSRDSNGGALV
jgi:hypothetical protein